MLEQVRQLLDRTRDLFFRYGIKSMTMDDIARQLGMSKKTIYTHFPDKKTMLKAMMSDFLQCHYQEVQQAKQDSSNAIEEMFVIAGLGMERMDKITPGFIFDLRKYHGDIWSTFETFRNTSIYQEVTSNIRRGISEGLFREDVDIEIAAHMHIQHLNLIVDPGSFAQTNKPVRSILYTIMITFIRGLATSKGLKELDKMMAKTTLIDQSNTINTIQS